METNLFSWSTNKSYIQFYLILKTKLTHSVRETKVMLLQTDWISCQPPINLAGWPEIQTVCHSDYLSFPIKKQIFKVFNSKQHLDLFSENYQTFKGSKTAKKVV